MAEPRVNIYVLNGEVYSVASDVTIDVYEFQIPSEAAEEFSRVRRYRAGGEHDVRDVEETRRLADAGDLTRNRSAD